MLGSIIMSVKSGESIAWSWVDAQLKWRSGMISNLIETVKGYAKFEKSILAEITELRSKVMNAGGTKYEK